MAAATAALGLAACGGSSGASTSSVIVKTGGSGSTSSTGSANTSTASRTATAPPPRPKPVFPPYPQLLHGATATSPTNFVPASRWQGQTAAWVAHSPSGVSLLSFDQRLAKLTLHSGTIDAGTEGWRYGPAITGIERRHLIAAFNGGFRLSTGAGGFMSYGKVAVPLRDGLGSIVSYSDGTTDIGSWHQGVPAPGKTAVSVRQNLNLLIDKGAPAANADCPSCWGATLGGVSDPARSALGITAHGRLIWAGGEHLTPSTLAGALLGARVLRAVELDINPQWVAGYLYGHRHGVGPLAPVQVLPDQPGIAGQLLTPYSRDFFTVAAR
ncbi:MAG TPA: hypothetical protein VGN69_06625 [Solirubrobacteraceae bacterium]|nr:hypothetical protein [Solirubrobacteraceae bacterium]